MDSRSRHLLWIDLALGPAVACLLLGLAAGRPRPLVGLLDSRPIRSLGLSSYSLYLIHAPIVVVMYARVVGPRYHQGPMAFFVMVAIVVPVTTVFARMFAAVFERPFLRQSMPSQRVSLSHPRLRRVAHPRP